MPHNKSKELEVPEEQPETTMKKIPGEASTMPRLDTVMGPKDVDTRGASQDSDDMKYEGAHWDYVSSVLRRYHVGGTWEEKGRDRVELTGRRALALALFVAKTQKTNEGTQPSRLRWIRRKERGYTMRVEALSLCIEELRNAISTDQTRKFVMLDAALRGADIVNPDDHSLMRAASRGDHEEAEIASIPKSRGKAFDATLAQGSHESLASLCRTLRTRICNLSWFVVRKVANDRESTGVAFRILQELTSLLLSAAVLLSHYSIPSRRWENLVHIIQRCVELLDQIDTDAGAVEIDELALGGGPELAELASELTVYTGVLDTFLAESSALVRSGLDLALSRPDRHEDITSEVTTSRNEDQKNIEALTFSPTSSDVIMDYYTMSDEHSTNGTSEADLLLDEANVPSLKEAEPMTNSHDADTMIKDEMRPPLSLPLSDMSQPDMSTQQHHNGNDAVHNNPDGMEVLEATNLGAPVEEAEPTTTTHYLALNNPVSSLYRLLLVTIVIGTTVDLGINYVPAQISFWVLISLMLYWEERAVSAYTPWEMSPSSRPGRSLMRKACITLMISLPLRIFLRSEGFQHSIIFILTSYPLLRVVFVRLLRYMLVHSLCLLVLRSSQAPIKASQGLNRRQTTLWISRAGARQSSPEETILSKSKRFPDFDSGESFRIGPLPKEIWNRLEDQASSLWCAPLGEVHIATFFVLAAACSWVEFCIYGASLVQHSASPDTCSFGCFIGHLTVSAFQLTAWRISDVFCVLLHLRYVKELDEVRIAAKQLAKTLIWKVLDVCSCLVQACKELREIACRKMALTSQLNVPQKLTALFRWHKIEAAVANLLSIPSEKPVATGKKRIRWRCRCGLKGYDDFVELRQGAASRMERDVKEMFEGNQGQRDNDESSGSAAATDITTSSPPGLSSGPPASENQDSHAMSPLGHSDDRDVVTTSRRSIPSSSKTLDRQWLLTCSEPAGRPTTLSHLFLYPTFSDQQLFWGLRRIHSSIKEATSWLSWTKKVKAISFIQFELHNRNYVDVRKVPDMPPETKKADYDFHPFPPELVPPVGTRLMTHLFHHPDDASCGRFIGAKSPKLTGSQLVGEGLLGWGIHLEEGVDTVFIWVTFGVFVLLSVAFAVVWTVLKKDISGAFGVASFMVTVGGVAAGLLQVTVA